ncbi:MAG: Spy/CpxP family protein refolding chaperone [Pyrinomonadaceae bacterium]
MKTANLFQFTLCSIFVLACGVAVLGQDDVAADEHPSRRVRPNLMAELALSPEQRQQIRQINQERRPLIQTAQQRMRQAVRNLDAAIYGDAASDSEVQMRLREFQLAQAEVARIRFASELAVRKILSPEQLTRFRSIRRTFNERREDFRDRRRMRRGLKPPGLFNRQPPPPGT